MTDCAHLPLNVSGLTAEDCRNAQEILSDDKNYIVRYLREKPTVAIGLVPVRNDEGIVIKNVPPKKKRVICSGKPFACMIAFEFDGNLVIGWSKLSDARDYEAEEKARENDPMFNTPIYIETMPFSRPAAKEAAVLRGLKDTISFNGKHATSGYSGVIPHAVEKALRGFVAEAERIYGETAINVGYPELPLAAQTGSPKAMVAGMSSGSL